MKVHISEVMFDKMLKAIKDGVATSTHRPEFGFIKIKVEGKKITAYVCDAYSGARMTFEALEHEGEDFQCLIKPIPFKTSKHKQNHIELSLEDNDAVLKTPTEYGNLIYHIKQNIVGKTDLEKIFTEMESHDREVGVNASFMARVMRNFSSVVSDRNKSVIIESKENNRLGFRIVAEEEDFTLEHFLMPLRINKPPEVH